MMLARYKKIANFTFLARWANLAFFSLVHSLKPLNALRLAEYRLLWDANKVPS